MSPWWAFVNLCSTAFKEKRALQQICGPGCSAPGTCVAFIVEATQEPCRNHDRRSANGGYFQYDVVPVSVRNHIGTMQEPRCRAASKSLFVVICSVLVCGTTAEPCGNHAAVQPAKRFRYVVVPISLRNHIGTIQEPRRRTASKVISVV